jgi:hypothetical protein
VQIRVISVISGKVLLPIRAHPRQSAVAFAFSDHQITHDHPIQSAQISVIGVISGKFWVSTSISQKAFPHSPDGLNLA